MVEVMPAAASANAEFKKHLLYIEGSSIFANPACLDAWNKPAGKGNDTMTLRKLG